MFTGIIEEIGYIHQFQRIGPEQSALTILCKDIQQDMKVGDSIAVDGACLTVIRFDANTVVFELSQETMTRTLFSKKTVQAAVNLERALRADGRLGGHLVQGHVDGLAQVTMIHRSRNFYEFSFELLEGDSKYLVSKGSIAINGISLTLASIRQNRFKTAIIPHTFLHTTLSKLSRTALVHVETDIIARYVERLLSFSLDSPEKSTLTGEFLRNHGFSG